MNQSINRLILFPIFITIFACAFWISTNKKESVETITFFPVDENAYFLDAKTTIHSPQTKGNQIRLPISTNSRLNENAYLRQDISLIFANGRLVEKFGEWRENTDKIKMDGVVELANDQVIHALSYHYGELHRNEEDITSSQTFSNDLLYMITDVNQDQFLFFRQPSNDEERFWKEKLDEKEKKLLDSVIQKAVTTFNLNLDHYNIIPIIQLPEYSKSGLPGFSKKQTGEIIGKLWEGIYKNYFLDIRKNDGEIVSPIGTTIPIILLAKNRSHLYVIFETNSNEIMYLKQLISSK
ncbi:hypothetical protein OEV82_11870 [Caldibacillus thermolactis]|jgi:hypothetical protein|uniref:Regulatory protein YycH-like domain-containing protein n=1 Tax=Pallidibacillus thermolactis TaxID=251051 RepID=A0ABT2WHG1_9BACI|nr:hypothetical protein [Pallidibacillus thermolactis]MCU9595135.1 hypothetical protein [Pallidibacillus thermolactis]